MGFWIYFGFYTFSIIVIWGFFLIAKVHSMKFSNYQPKIETHTNIITIILAILTLIGYVLIFIMGGSSNSYEVDTKVSNDNNIEKNIDNFSDLSEKDDILPKEGGEYYY